MTMPAESIPARLPVEGEVTIATVAQHAPALIAALSPGAAVELDLGAVTHLDGAGLQLLMLVAREGRMRNVPVRVAAASRAVRDALDLARLDDAFEPLSCACACSEAHA